MRFTQFRNKISYNLLTSESMCHDESESQLCFLQTFHYPLPTFICTIKNFRITSDQSLKRKRYNSISHTSVGMLRHHFIILLYYYIVVVLRIVHICVVSAWLKLVKGVICVVVLLCLTNIFTPCPTIGNNWLLRKSSFIR